jgi:hypothetical protein
MSRKLPLSRESCISGMGSPSEPVHSSPSFHMNKRLSGSMSTYQQYNGITHHSDVNLSCYRQWALPVNQRASRPAMKHLLTRHNVPLTSTCPADGISGHFLPENLSLVQPRTCRSARGQLALCCLCPSILEALQLLRLDRQIPLFETVHDAIVGVGGTI